MKLVKPDDPILHRVCRPDFTIDGDDIQTMFRLLAETDGLGLAAPQVGIDGRLFVTEWGEVFVNPVFTRLGDPLVFHEGCLSFPGRLCARLRHPAVRMADGRVYEGLKAIVIQHEADHLDGICITDPLPEANHA